MLNHFFFLFIFPLPGGCCNVIDQYKSCDMNAVFWMVHTWRWIWTKEAGAKEEVVSWEEGEEKPAKETGPEGEGRPKFFWGNTG